MKAHAVWIALASCLLTLGAVLVLLNLASGEKKIEQRLERLYPTEDPQFRRAMGNLLGPPILDGNQTQVLVNGDEIFAAMLGAIRHARRTITFETYIYWSETIGREFADALIERARAGVRVHVLLDWVGSAKMEARYLEEMKAAGIEVERYHEPHWTNLQRMNNRTHRKLLVVDGAIGFTGGVGIADKWRGNAQDKAHWRDTHFRVEGPVVAQMQSVFMDNWIKATGRVMHGADYFPPLTPRGAEAAQMFGSSPYRRQREHAPDVPDGHHGGDAQHPPVQLVFRAGRSRREGPRGGGPARRRGPDHHARSRHRYRAGASRVARPMG
jgi:cardiolipin synthase